MIIEHGYTCIYRSSTGGEVHLHALHGPDELFVNTQAARILADHGHFVELLPALPANAITLRDHFLPDVAGHKNPDMRINKKVIGDIKTPTKDIKQSTINRSIYSCAQQRVELAVINLSLQIYSVQDIKKGIIGALQPSRNKSIRDVWIITNQKNIFHVNRTMVFEESVYEELIRL